MPSSQESREEGRLRGEHGTTGHTGSMNRIKQERAMVGRRRISGEEFSPHSDGSVATAVGVVNDSIEGLVHPLPEHHGWGLPEGTKTLTSFPSAVLFILGP